MADCRWFLLSLTLAACAPAAVETTEAVVGVDAVAAVDAIAADAEDPAAARVCMPCRSDADCRTASAQNAACIPLYAADNPYQTYLRGSFCAIPCVARDDVPGSLADNCPSGYVCQGSAVSQDGAVGNRCVPASGECACDVAWVGKSTMCDRGNWDGDCSAIRTCQLNADGQAFLSQCMAAVPEEETCGEGIDRNCNGLTDEPGSIGCTPRYVDEDGDGWGGSFLGCLCGDLPKGFVSKGYDCQDGDPAIHPSATEICDGIDNNCNGLTDTDACDDGNSCTIDSCGTEQNCVHVNDDGAFCYDNNVCTDKDVCSGGVCKGTAQICGDGVCNCAETVANCPGDCSFLTDRLAGPCQLTWSWDGCPDGYLCVERSAEGGGNVCVADFETWPPIADSHPAEDYTQASDYVVDNKTGLFWSHTAQFASSPEAPGCASVSVGGFADWRDPTVAELQSLIDLSKGGWGTGAATSAGWSTVADRGNGAASAS
jgi:hypothetical protein